MPRLARPTFNFENGPINIDRVYGRVSDEQIAAFAPAVMQATEQKR